MIANVGVRTYRPAQPAHFNRQRVAARPVTFSAAFIKFFGGILVAAVFAAMATTQVLNWWVLGAESRVEQLQASRDVTLKEYQRLTNIRDQLKSPNRMQAVAGVKLDLYVPGEGQVHKM